DGTSWNTSVKILQDPRIPIQKEDLLTQEKIVLDMRSDLNLLASTVESIRAVRNQFVSRNKLLMDDSAAEKLIEASKKAIEKLDKLEEELHNPKAKIAYDILAQKGGAKLYSRLIFLYNCALDDGGPTQGELEVYIELKKLLKQILNDWNEFKSKTLVDLNNQAKQQDAPIVVVPKVKKPG
ncbi:MAG TPA: hypothetical protein PKA06_13805, partial [Gemmatales bacterium]|nr:hypothetical protein [Gemmatales bacterium]